MSCHGYVSGFGFLLEQRAAVNTRLGVRQYQVNEDGSCGTHGWHNTSWQTLHDMDRQQEQAAWSSWTWKGRFAPAWECQRVFIAIPTRGCSEKEWRLCSRAVSLGQVMIALGGQFSARDIIFFWESLVIVAEKKHTTATNAKKRAARD